MLTARAYKVNSPGAWRQSARAEFVSYEAVGIEPTFFYVFCSREMVAELEYISALWQLCYISRGHRKLYTTWFSNAHETENIK